MTQAAKKFLSYFLKAAILVLAVFFIYRQFLKKGDSLDQFQRSVAKLDHNHVIIIMTIVVLLMFANWVFEAVKWRYLTRQLYPMNLWKAIECVFCGLTWAIVTPNRIGDYGGRVMFLPSRKRIHGVFAMAVGSFAQNVITNLMGLSAVVWFIYTFKNFDLWISVIITLMAIVIIALFLVLYFNIQWMVWLLDRVKFLRKFHRFFEIMAAYKFTQLLSVIGLSLTRYLIFTFQYYLVIHLLVPSIPFYDIFPMVFLVLFIQSALPSLDLLDIAVRSAAATAIFGYVTHEQVAIVAAFASIWLINLIIPAILGTIFIFKLNFFDRSV